MHLAVRVAQEAQDLLVHRDQYLHQEVVHQRQRTIHQLQLQLLI